MMLKNAYRPMYVQKIFWNVVHDERFVANPIKMGQDIIVVVQLM
ncbi:MAG TPA: hypothetical protein VIM70_14575 [Clostridium sp.]